jgi:hypothetical protein
MRLMLEVTPQPHLKPQERSSFYEIQQWAIGRALPYWSRRVFEKSFSFRVRP